MSATGHCVAPVPLLMETSMAQLDRQTYWVVTENIARFQEQLKTESDIGQRKLLQGLLVLEREKLRALSESDR
jgi:hypothetical protein